MANERVVVLKCAATASDDAVRDAVFRAADRLGDAVARGLSGKRRIFLKANMGTNDFRTHRGRHVALSDKGVIRAVVALIRQYHGGELYLGDATTGHPAALLWDELGYGPALAPYDVRPVDLKDGPFTEVAVPGGGVLHTHYWLARTYADADAVVSCAKLKAHVSTGSTGSLKNLFGTLPTAYYGSPRRYLHAPVRLPRAIVDCGLMKPPVLCVIDGLVGQLGREWHGEPVETDTLIMGTNCVATDATAMRVQGMDPTADYGAWPFHWDNNVLVLARDAGLGPNAEEGIDILGDGIAAVRQQFTMVRPRSADWDRIRREVAREAVRYAQETRDTLVARYAGELVALAGGQVIEHGGPMETFGKRIDYLEQTQGYRNGIFVKRVLPAAAEQEHLGVYAPIAAAPAFTA